MARIRSFAEILHKEGFEEGKRKGYSSGLAQGLVESLAESLAKGLAGALQEVLAGEFLHCLERGRRLGMREFLAEAVEVRFGEGPADEVAELIEPVKSAKVLKGMARHILWRESEKALLASLRKEVLKATRASESDAESGKVH